MLHPKVRRAVAVAAIAGVTVTAPLATAASAQDEVGPDSTQSSSSPEGPESPESPAVPDTLADDVVSPPAGHRVRLRIKNQDVRAVVTTRTWARRLLADERVGVDGNDLVRVRRDGDVVRGHQKRKLRAGDAVQLIAVDKKVRTKRKSIKPRTRTKTVSRLRPGQREVIAKGRPGVKKIRVVKTRHNGTVVDKKRSAHVVRRAKARKVAIGRAAHSVPGADHLNWGALANCESSGNPRAVNPAGYYGLYQFNVPTWNSVGGSGIPSNASASEQTYRAKLLYKQRGRSPWPHCGRYL